MNDMNDMSAVIIPKSDQINADDLLTGSRTITIERVSIRPGTEQPVSIHFEGDNGKPYKPCKSMARVMVHLWGADANHYVGRSMTLYCDHKVLWGGLAVGGIRISHMSHINDASTMALTATKGSRKPFTVRPLATRPSPVHAADEARKNADSMIGILQACETIAKVNKFIGQQGVQEWRAWAKDNRPELATLVDSTIAEVANKLMPPPDEDDTRPRDGAGGLAAEV